MGKGERGRKDCSKTMTAIKWLFVGLYLPWDLDLRRLDGRVGWWMNREDEA